MSSQYLTLYKMIVLYMLRKSDGRLSKAQIYDFILEKEYTNFLTLQEVFGELAESELITENIEGSRTFLKLTDAGSETLDFFGNRINPSIREQIDTFFRENGLKMRDETSIGAYYKKTGENEYMTYLSAAEFGEILVELHVPAITEDMAETICENWKKKNQNIYRTIMTELM
ncbi:DUF4364 family protein [Butyrivibrio sp. INlla16]|uniref:DUF4364 family protein n=1 Tax=Butyrivibrio sp. INlla16 TaxID=1520807 RepID=UPI00088DDD05|nr:DUF4364 family protein [Butyrivibrio sp. INlla16]SDB45107.1 protein of unknown function [Butyrivibrio sp. INlla16]